LAGTAVNYSTELQMLIKKTLPKKSEFTEDPASIKSIRICQDFAPALQEETLGKTNPPYPCGILPLPSCPAGVLREGGARPTPAWKKRNY
jgi:hypothetical protein